jgi:hypothetical protein
MPRKGCLWTAVTPRVGIRDAAEKETLSLLYFIQKAGKMEAFFYSNKIIACLSEYWDIL